MTGTRFREGRAEAAIDVANGMALSVPDFLWGLILILLFGVLFPVFQHLGPRHAPRWTCPSPPTSTCSKASFACASTLTRDLVGHMFMPALALAIPLAAIIGQLLKQSLKETMHLDYVTLARTKGYGETQVILREALPQRRPARP